MTRSIPMPGFTIFAAAALTTVLLCGPSCKDDPPPTPPAPSATGTAARATQSPVKLKAEIERLEAEKKALTDRVKRSANHEQAAKINKTIAERQKTIDKLREKLKEVEKPE